MQNTHLLEDVYFRQIQSIIASRGVALRVHFKYGETIAKVRVSVIGEWVGVMQLFDLNGNQLADDHVVFDRAIQIITDPRTDWVLAGDTVMSRGIYPSQEKPLQWLQRLYGEVKDPLSQSHTEVERLKMAGHEEELLSAEEWEHTLVKESDEFFGDQKQYAGRAALRRSLVHGDVAWRYVVRYACVNLLVYKRLAEFLGADEEAEERFEHYKKVCKLKTIELAGIDALAHQFDFVNEKRGYAYNKSLAWRDMLSEGPPDYATYVRKLREYTTERLYQVEESYAGFLNRYATAGESQSDSFTELWIEVRRRHRAEHYYDYLADVAERRSLDIEEEEDVPPSYPQHHYTRWAAAPSLELSMEAVGLPPPTYFSTLGAAPTYFGQPPTYPPI